MNAIPNQQTAGMLAEIPVFDWRGPEFLIFYGLAFLAAAVWSSKRRAKLLDRLNAPQGREATLRDPYEMAFLAGGVPRCAQLAVVRLLEKRALEWKSGKWFSSGRMVARNAAGLEMNDIEKAVYQGAAAARGKGLGMQEVIPLAKPLMSRIEVRLAGLGLRPTPAEKSGLGFRATLPLVALMALGVVKVGIGLVRDRPVAFLVVILVLSFITAIVLASGIGRLTPAGESTLSRLRDERSSGVNTAQPDSETISLSLALLGPSALADHALLTPGQMAFKKELGRMGDGSAAASSSSGCGGYSGCGSGGGSGCGGGGGCGGCGGGGD